MPTAISPEQLAANRANATHSTGPATAEGKATSARNRTTHGFRSSTVLLPGDDPAEYNELLAELETHFGEPQDIAESRFIREMADAEWRLRRVRAHMESAIARHMATLPQLDATDLQSLAIETLSQTGCSYGTWLRYEAKFERQYDRACAAWTRYQHEIRRAAATAAKTAIDEVLAQALVDPEMGSNVQNQPVQSVTRPGGAGPRPVAASQAASVLPDNPPAVPATSPVQPQSHALRAA